MKFIKRMIALMTILTISFSFAACKASDPSADTADGQGGGSDTVTLNIGYSYGQAYAPLLLCQEKQLIEKAYQEATGNRVNVVWNQIGSGADIITGMASTSLHDDNPELYQALCSAVSESIDSVNSDFEAAAKITCEYDGNSYEDELLYLQKGNYSTSVKGILEFAKFMYRNSFIDKEFSSLSDIAFENVTGD